MTEFSIHTSQTLKILIINNHAILFQDPHWAQHYARTPKHDSYIIFKGKSYKITLQQSRKTYISIKVDVI